MSKYYTPELEEFHVGFEYQYSEYRNCIWKNEVFAEGRGVSYDGEIDGEEIRVKYLDSEDIESLGFVQITDDCYNLPIGNEELRLLFKNNIFKIYLADKYSDMLFQGTIKNKSELKRLLKQLGI